MKALLLFLAAFSFGWIAHAEDIAPADAGKHIGENATVKGVVVQVTKGAKAVFLNFGAKYPDNVFTAVSFNLPFSALSGFEGKTVSVTGTVKDYQGKPEIVVSNLSQIAP